MRLAGFLFFTALAVACGARTGLPQTRPHSPLCGNGVVDPGEACDQGSANADAPAFSVTQGNTTLQVRPIVQDRSAASFYDLVGFSSHSGLEVEGESRLYLYLDVTTHALSLVINHNIVNKGTGAAKKRFDGGNVSRVVSDVIRYIAYEEGRDALIASFGKKGNPTPAEAAQLAPKNSA